MAEIVDDLKISNVEITNSLGINLTSDITRIKHTGNDEFYISSSGELTISTEKKNTGNDCDINLYAGAGQDVDGEDEGGDIRLYSGDGGANGGDGGDIRIVAGDGITGNYEGGYVEIYSGYGAGEGGYIDIIAGDGDNNDGGDVYIGAGYGYQNGGYIQLRAGDSNIDNPTNDSSAGPVDIYGGDSYGENATSGYINIYSGNDYSTGTGGYGGDLYLQSGYSQNGTGGFLGIYGGNGSVYGGAVRIEAGTKSGNNANNGADVQIYGGYSNGTGVGGSIIIRAGNSAANGRGGIIISQGPAEKIGFFGNTPVIRPASTGETGGVVQNNGFELRDNSTFTGNLGDKAYTISDIVKALKQLGFLDTYEAAPGVEPASMPEAQPRVEKPKKERKEQTDKTAKTE